MNYTHQADPSEHQEILTLLPWYVNKTLHSDEKHRVETHLKSCLVCKIELSNQQRLLAAISQEDSLAPVAHASFLQLKNRIHNTGGQTEHKSGVYDVYTGCLQWIASFKNLVAKHPYFDLAAVFLFAFILFFPVYYGSKQISENEFHTLSSTQNIVPKENEIRIVFSNDIKQKQINQILATVEGHIIAGPSPQGVFRVRIDNEKMAKKDLMETISLLRQNMNVIFAEPTLALVTRNNQSLE